MINDKLKKHLKQQNKLIDQKLKKFLPPKNKSILTRAMHYSVFAGGKRFRPILMLAVAEALGKDQAKVIPAACAMELVHTFTLIHDDLPAMDNDDFRRGKPSCHRAFGEDIAILAGDALQALAFEIMAPNSKGIFLLAKALGSEGVVGGQVRDLESEGKKITLNQLYQIHREKTASLMKAAVNIAALVLKASIKQQKALNSYAEHLGLAFQIKDDLLDELSSFKTLGKKPGGDQKKKKATFPKLLGINQTKLKGEEELKKTIKSVASMGKRAKILIDLANYVFNR